jgi:hypothetical protein
LRKTVGVVALLVSFRGDLEREETGGGTGRQRGEMPGTLTSSTDWMKHDAKITKLAVGRRRLIDPGATQTVDTLGRCGLTRYHAKW